MKLMKFKMSPPLTPKQMKSVLSLFITIMVMGITGCASPKLAPLELDKIAKEFAPPAHKSYIYVMRNYTFDSNAILMKVLLKEHINFIYEREVSFLAADTYVLFEVSPGKYEVITKSAPRVNKGIIQLETLPGRAYFIASQFGTIDPDLPLYIELLPNEVGKKTILENNYKRVVSSISEE